MAIALIQEWLNGNQDYQAGVLLYEKFGQNASLKKIFAAGSNVFTRKKLIAELETLSMQNAPGIKEQPKPEATIPPDLIKIQAQTKNKYKDMSALHQRLEDEMTDEERGVLALNILNMDDQIQDGYNVVDHFKETGKRVDPPEPKKRRGKPVEKMTPQELYLALKNIPTYITKVKKQIAGKDLKPGRLPELQGMLAIYENDLIAVKKKLNIE